MLLLVRRHAVAIGVVVVVVIICRYNQHGGHDYGDDFALYIRQARAITHWDIHQVVSQNEFALKYSSWHTFSQSIYPWGFPIILAPFYAAAGIDYSLFKLVEALLFGGFLLLLYGVVNKRTGRLGGVVVMTTIGVSVAFVSWTDTVLSDIPYLLFAFLSLWLLDRVRMEGGFEADRLWPLIAVGVAAGYGFSTRREGAALLPAVLAAQFAWVAGRWWHRDRGQPFRLRWSRLLTPILSFVGFVGGLRLFLPTPFFESYPQTGLKQLRANMQAYGSSLAEQIGLKDPGRNIRGGFNWGFAGSASLAKWLFGAIIVLITLGIVVRLLTAFAEDISLFTFIAATLFIIGIAPFRDSRYLFSVTPLLVYFAYQGIAGIPTWRRGRSADRGDDGARRRDGAGTPLIATMLASATVGMLMIANASDTAHKTTFRHDFGTYTFDGVAQPSWQELFSEVRTVTRPTDVVAFFRARTMVLYTDRNSIQSQGIETVVQNADYYAQRKDPTNYSQAPLDADAAASLGFQKIWENSQFILWQVPKQ